jgi:sirohydrochlorin ferrochelatase
MPVLLLAAHGTRSAAGLSTTVRLVEAVRAARPSVTVDLCFLDVLAPSLGQALDRLAASDVVVVPLLLSAGYHVTTDIPRLVAGRPSVRVSRHLGPDPLLVGAVAGRLRAVAPELDERTVALAGIASSRPSARAEVDRAAELLADELSRPVRLLPLDGSLEDAVAGLPGKLAVATYLLAEGGFLDALRKAVGERGVVADPIGVDPTLVALVWSRYDQAAPATG